ncbi:MAG TPA: lytic transglycosylase domain-containing protein [Roseiarcus sp.]|nr:lytic transglycosylase domain-containing protein [Roseiarcus sp.]
MTISRFGPLLAIVGAACLVSWTPEERAVKPTPRLALSEPNPSASPDPAASKPAASKPAPRGAESLESPSAVGAISAIAPASLTAPAASDKPVKVELAYADLEGAAPALGALSAVTPRAGTAALEPRAPAGAAALPPPARTPEAVILYNKGDAAGLLALASTATGADERSALEWASLRADGRPSFDSLAAFLEAHPDWPSRAWIRDRQEAELATHPQAPAEVAAFFARDPPQSTAGKIAAARAAQATGRPEEASQIIRSLWRDGNFDGPTEGVILRDFAISLTKADHAYRASRLIYAGYLSAGARAAALAGPDVLALAQARIAAAREPMSPALVKAVPPALRNDPGLLFSRIQYARRAGRVYEATVMLNLAPRDRDALINRDRWWSERKMVARALLDLDEPRLAFEVCDETVRPDSSEAQVDAAFHAGWIALRFLDDAPVAARRFALAAEAAENPLSLARAAYWQGRAAEAMGESEAARTFYARAAGVPIAYYGQLAAQRLGETRLSFRKPAVAAVGERRDEAVRVVEALYADGLDDLAAGIAFDAARNWRDESQLAAMAEVVKSRDDPGTQVQFAKIAVMRGQPLEAMAFPSVGMPGFVPLSHSADLPTVYAVARQESEFIWHSASGAGAKGLMQMLPSTAAVTARRAGVDFDSARLIVDPAFNAQLGAALLGQLIEDEHGSRELAFAAYNAGPGRVAQWIAAHGDPRDGSVDLVDWIERIPFDETRDYVERVSENLGVYRQRFADEKPAPPPVSARLARE